MRVLLTGAGGQLATELERTQPADVELIPRASADLDLRDAGSVAQTVAALRPEVVVNAAAYTAVDRAEEEPDEAFAVNAEGVAHLAQAALDAGARLLHVSTDFVFDGRARRPYRPEDPAVPRSVYGRSKAAGERLALEILGERCAVVRTSWLYSSHGANFVRTMLRLMGDRDAVEVVDDQEGSPTWAALLARALWRLAPRDDLAGLWHWSDDGSCTRHGFAVAIQDEALARGLLEREIEVRPVATAAREDLARRPGYSVLDASATRAALDLAAVPWRAALGRMLDEMRGEDLHG